MIRFDCFYSLRNPFTFSGHAYRRLDAVGHRQLHADGLHHQDPIGEFRNSRHSFLPFHRIGRLGFGAVPLIVFLLFGSICAKQFPTSQKCRFLYGNERKTGQQQD